MALINCPECSKEISDKASSCPFCGCPVNSKNKPQEVKVIAAPNKEGCFLQTLNIGCMIGAVVIIITILFFIFSR